MKYKDLIVSHSLLSNNYFLTSVDYEVASLIKLAVLTTANSIVLIHLVKLTELRSKHYRYLANHNSGGVKLAEDLLDLSLALTSLRVGVIGVPL